MTEYGADTFPGLHRVTPQPWTEEYQVELLDDVPPGLRPGRRRRRRAGLELRRLRHRAPAVIRVDGNKKGVFTRDRRPKAAAYALRRRWRQQR